MREKPEPRDLGAFIGGRGGLAVAEAAVARALADAVFSLQCLVCLSRLQTGQLAELVASR